MLGYQIKSYSIVYLAHAENLNVQIRYEIWVVKPKSQNNSNADAWTLVLNARGCSSNFHLSVDYSTSASVLRWQQGGRSGLGDTSPLIPWWRKVVNRAARFWTENLPQGQNNLVNIYVTTFVRWHGYTHKSNAPILTIAKNVQILILFKGFSDTFKASQEVSKYSYESRLDTWSQNYFDVMKAI